MLQVTVTDSGSADHERAVADGFIDGSKNLGARENRRSAHRRARFSECGIVRVHEAQVRATKVAQRARGGANIEGIAR